MSDPQDREDEEGGGGGERFVSIKPGDKKGSIRSGASLASQSADSVDSQDQQRSVAFRLLLSLLPCLWNKGIWKQDQEGGFKGHGAGEAEYPISLMILESNFFDVIFVTSCLASIYLFLFSEGFLLESRLLWGIIHSVNAVYALSTFFQWLQILIRSKYVKTSHGYTTKDIVYTLISVFPADLIVLLIYTLNDEDDNEDNEGENPIEHWMITVSRLNYFLRFRSLLQYLSKWEDHLVIGDFSMLLLRVFMYTAFLLHMFACVWHRLACRSFRLKHFLMTPDEATADVCEEQSWVGYLKLNFPEPLMNHPDWPVLLTHYLASVYWTIVNSFKLGCGDVVTTLTENKEVAYVILAEIVTWVYVLVNVSGTLASLFIEKDTEKENFLTRCFAIRHYLRFTEVARQVQDEVYKFYAYIWAKSRGIVEVDLIEEMPRAMKSEVFYDVNKFVMDQMPMVKGLDSPFLMGLSVHTTHKFYLSGEYLYRKNETASSMYYLVKGHLEVMSDCEQHVLATIRSGSIIGEVHLLQPYPHVSTVRCGSDCDIMVLSRVHFRQVLNTYPQHLPTLEQRLDNRLEQSGLLLALCEKHNTYRKAFKTLREAISAAEGVTYGSPDQERISVQKSTNQMGHSTTHSFENIAKILGFGVPSETDKLGGSQDDDFDGLEIREEIVARLENRGLSSANRHEIKKLEEAVAQACIALEADVTRAGSLAKDLNIPRPALTVTAPDSSSGGMLGFGHHQQQESGGGGNICVPWLKMLRDTGKDGCFIWDMIVAFCALGVFWYYPYQFAFRDHNEQLYDYIFHLTDFIFVLDFFYDSMQVVVTPQKTHEAFKEIFIYRLKTFYFYLRFISFLPLEYILATPLGIGPPYFYLFKFNRLLIIHQVYPFLINVETEFDFITPIIMSLFVLVLAMCFITHMFAVFYKFVLRDINGDSQHSYREEFYRALVVTTSVGYGDIRGATSGELVVEIIGLMLGVSAMVYLQAKVTAMLVNSERQRVAFQQIFYALKTFMNQRKFPKLLKSRVSEYYKLQWQAHEGTLPPEAQETIWDAPKTLIARVALSVGQKYISRIPMFTNCPMFLITEFCLALNHYIIPPGEVLLYPDEHVRDLYIISKGFVEVIYKGKIVGVFTEGRYFGLNGLVTGVNKGFMFRTVTHCQILSLTFESFMKVANSNSHFLQEFQLLTSQDQDQDQTQLESPDDAKSRPSQTLTSATADNQSTDSDFEQLLYPPPEFLESLMEDAPDFEDDMTPPDETDATKTKKKGSRLKSFIQCLMCKCRSKKSHSHHRHFYIRPHGAPLKCWMGFRLACAVFSIIFAPAQLTFPISPRNSFLVTFCFDFVAWIDIIIGMRTAYLGDQNQLVTAPKQMALHYLKGNFLLDFIACLPADYIAFATLAKEKHFGHKYHIIAFLRLNRTLQIFKLFMTKNLLEKTMFKSLSFIMSMELVPISFLIVNICTFLSILPVCSFTQTGDPMNCSENDAWILNGVRKLRYIDPLQGLYDTHDIFAPFLVGLYWVVQTVFGLGVGDIDIGMNAGNQIVAILVILAGILAATYIGGKLTSCISGENANKLDLEEKLKLMNEYLETHHVSRNCRRRVSEVYVNRWDKSNGVTPADMFAALPPTLKTDVMKQLYGSNLKTSPLFENLDAPGIRMLASTLSEIYYSEGEFLMKFGDLCTDVFFIANGAVVCYNAKGDIMSQMGSGSLIGEVSQFFHTHRLYNAIAVKDVSAYVFKKEDFMKFLEQYPYIKHVVEACSVRHYKEAMTGFKKVRSVDVLVTYQNEKEKGGEESGRPMDAKSQKSGSGSGGSIFRMSMSSSSRDSQYVDMTRNKLEEDAMNSPDDFTKGVQEVWWSVFVTFGRKTRDEMGLVHIYQELDKCTIINFAIHPVSSVCGWVSFCLVVAAVSCGITAYEMAFASEIRHTETLPLTVARFTLELFYVIRIIGNLHLGYYDETNTLITDVKQITRRYAYSVDGMWLDFVTTFPFYLIEYVVPSLKGEYIRSIQLLRVMLFIRYIRETDTRLKLKASPVKILKITIMLCFIFHFWACAWYLVACTDTCITGSWMQKILDDFDKTPGKSKADVTTASRYFLALYYVTNALTYTGFAEITALTKVELGLTIAMVFATVFVIGYLIGDMVQCLASQVASKITYQHKLEVLETHFESLGITSSKIEEVRHYFKLLWCRCRGMRFHSLMEELPYTLRADVAFELYGPNMKSSKLLGKLDDNLTRQISAQVRHEIYFPGSHIVRAGDVCHSMYFIKKGEVVILDGNSNLDLCVEILYENECFGEVKILLPRDQYRFSYVARVESEVGVLYKEDLEAVLKHHPKIFQELKDKANRIKARRQKLKEEENKDRNSTGGGHHRAVNPMSMKTTTTAISKAKTSGSKVTTAK